MIYGWLLRTACFIAGTLCVINFWELWSKTACQLPADCMMTDNEICKNLSKLANIGTYGTQHALPLALAKWELVRGVLWVLRASCFIAGTLWVVNFWDLWMKTACHLPANCLATACQLTKDCLSTACQLPANSCFVPAKWLKTACQLPANCLKTACQLTAKKSCA